MGWGRKCIRNEFRPYWLIFLNEYTCILIKLSIWFSNTINIVYRYFKKFNSLELQLGTLGSTYNLALKGVLISNIFGVSVPNKTKTGY